LFVLPSLLDLSSFVLDVSHGLNAADDVSQALDGQHCRAKEGASTVDVTADVTVGVCAVSLQRSPH
jgi:hypothetical protein